MDPSGPRAATKEGSPGEYGCKGKGGNTGDKSLKWERNTNMNAKDLLKIFSDELKATTEELFP